jgi:hypothetical protein
VCVCVCARARECVWSCVGAASDAHMQRLGSVRAVAAALCARVDALPHTCWDVDCAAASLSGLAATSVMRSNRLQPR